MEIANKTEDKILSILLKEPFNIHTVTSLANALKITRPGLWKALSKLNEKKLITVEKIGETKTSSAILLLNWKSPLTEKALSFILTREALNYERWRFDFQKLEDKVGFLIIFGSILNSPKEANDIDVLSITKKNLGKIGQIISEIQKNQNKKVHAINMTPNELETELRRRNPAYIDALKKGVVLFGQDNFIKYIYGLNLK